MRGHLCRKRTGLHLTGYAPAQLYSRGLSVDAIFVVIMGRLVRDKLLRGAFCAGLF